MKIWIPEEAAQTDHPPQHRTAMFMSSSNNKTNVNHEALPNLVQSQQRQTTTSCQKNKNIAETSHPKNTTLKNQGTSRRPLSQNTSRPSPRVPPPHLLISTSLDKGSDEQKLKTATERNTSVIINTHTEEDKDKRHDIHSWAHSRCSGHRCRHRHRCRCHHRKQVGCIRSRRSPSR